MLRLEVCLYLLFLGSALGQQQVVPCLTSRASCSAVTSGISMINNNVFCCSAGFSMSFVNNVCSCRKISDVFPCLSDPQKCRFADSFSTDGNGNTRCCLPDTFMSSSGRSINGQYINTCNCERPLYFSAVEFKRRMREWQRQFANRMAAFQSNLQQYLGNLFRSLGIAGR
ncbi:uncharacterized protein [Littorina saxatilis]|uniref:Uncharacterized protein n=1 Tax=Littorina saxatilis TaxID=31220 RepID=A0AAN9BT79_9CAEN